MMYAASKWNVWLTVIMSVHDMLGMQSFIHFFINFHENVCFVIQQ